MNKYTVYIKIHDFSYDYKEISKLLNIVPDIAWNKGDLFNEEKDLKRKFSTWQIKEEVVANHISFNVLYRKIFKRIKGKESILQDIIKDHSGEFTIVAYLKNQKNPGIFVDKKFISILSTLGLSFDLDFYFIGKL